MEHPGVTCPFCGCWKSPKKLYRSIETALTSIGKKHCTRCNECGTAFEYTPQVDEVKRRRLGIPGLNMTTTEIVMTEMTITEEGKL